MIWREVLGSRRGGRLVDQQELGVLGERAGDADALALPAGERVGALVGMVDQADAVEQRKAFAMSAGGKRRVKLRQKGT
jgi:hypothetical protein